MTPIPSPRSKRRARIEIIPLIDKQQGRVMLEVEVNASGRPTSVRLKTSSGFPLLDQAALEAVRRWEFEPGTIGGVPTASRVEIPVRFNFPIDKRGEAGLGSPASCTSSPGSNKVLHATAAQHEQAER